MRRLPLLLAVLAALTLPLAAPAGARPQQGGLVTVNAARYITACSGHLIQAQHTTAAGNLYRLEGHLCLSVNAQSGNSLANNARWHGHCTRNGADWTGCRVNTELVVEVLTSSGWQDRGATAFDISAPVSGYFANSSTYSSFSDYFADGLTIRAKAEDEDNMRFLLADGSTVLKDMLDAAGPGTTVCTVDPC